MVALLAEKRLTISQLAKREGVNSSTVWRWINRGVRGVKLVTFTVGGRDFTTDSLFEKFVRETSAAKHGAQSVFQASSVAASDHEAEEKFLAEELG